MATNVYLMTLFMVLGTVVLLAGLRYLGLKRQATSRVESEEAYRALAAKAAAAQSETTAALASVQSALSGINTRLAAVETMLKDVG